jgi:hypothetical protein
MVFGKQEYFTIQFSATGKYFTKYEAAIFFEVNFIGGFKNSCLRAAPMDVVKSKRRNMQINALPVIGMRFVSY